MKVHVSTYGCSASQASAEIMKASIRDKGHDLVPEKDAEVLVINTCTVKYTTEQKILHKIAAAGDAGKEVIVSGCMPEVQLEVILNQNPQAHILGINSVSKITDVIGSLGSGNGRMQVFMDEPEGFQNVPRIRYNSNIHICQLSQGCDFSCSYCIVSIARGKLRSFRPEGIVADIKTAVSEGCREVWLTSQDNGQYGNDAKVLLPELLKMICDIPGNFKIRVGMMNPFSVVPIIDDLLDAFDNEKIYKLLHLPIQSASDAVLNKMNRYHSVSEANMVIERFRGRFPDITLFTDIIVGFSGESDDDFEKTLEWVKHFRPDKVNISRYTPRPHTKAWDYRKIDSRIIVQRSNELHSLCEGIKLEVKNMMIGWEGEVFISKEAKTKGMMARSASYKPVVIPVCDVAPGVVCKVRVYDATAGYFLAEII